MDADLSKAIFQGWDGLSLGTSLFHLLLKLSRIADSREEVRLAPSIAVKCREPFGPLLPRSLGFLEVNDHGIIQARKESVVDDCFVLPAVDCPRNKVAGLADELGSFFEIELRSFNVVKLKGVLLEH